MKDRHLKTFSRHHKWVFVLLFITVWVLSKHHIIEQQSLNAFGYGIYDRLAAAVVAAGCVFGQVQSPAGVALHVSQTTIRQALLTCFNNHCPVLTNVKQTTPLDVRASYQR